MKAGFSYSLFLIMLILAGCKSHRHAAASSPSPETQTTTQTSASKATVPNDMQVIVTEEMLNKCFKALGPISGKEPYTILFVNDSFTWTLVNPEIHLHTGRADFTTDVNVTAGSFSYTTKCSGDVGIWYDRPKNLINVKITRCIIEIYTKILGAKYHIKDVDIASKFTDPFTFEGPTATSSETDMEMPDGSIRKLYMTTTDCDLTVQEKQIVVPCEVDFSLTPPKQK